jgi:hypothetical protein
VKYLFGETATISDVVEAQRRGLPAVVDNISPEEFRRKPIDELVDAVVERLRLDVPVLDRTAIVQLPTEEVDIDVTHDPMRAIIPGSGPYIVKGSEVRIGVPFTGEAALFKYGTAPYPFIHSIPGEVDDTHVVLTYRAEHPDATAVKADFEGRLGQIEQVLTMTRSRAEDWNRELANLARARISARQQKLEQAGLMSLGYPIAPRKRETTQAVRREQHPAEPGPEDVFLSHASEDKEAIARPLYDALTAAGVSVWYDDAVLELGDSLRRKIDEGLARCRYGIVILSQRFFEKDWPQRELDGLVAKETAFGEKAILPIWHHVERADVARRSPMLADRLAGKSDEGVDALVQRILRVLRR